MELLFIFLISSYCTKKSVFLLLDSKSKSSLEATTPPEILREWRCVGWKLPHLYNILRFNIPTSHPLLSHTLASTPRTSLHCPQHLHFPLFPSNLHAPLKTFLHTKKKHAHAHTHTHTTHDHDRSHTTSTHTLYNHTLSGTFIS